MLPLTDVAVVLLTGGRSSRMGTPKAWLDFDGRPLVVRMVESLCAWARDIVIVAAPEQALPALDATAAPGARLTILRDDRPGEGPLPALALGLAAVAAPWALALGCDTPLVRRELLVHLAGARADVDAVVPCWDDRPQPLLALYRATLAPTLTAMVAGGERRLHAIASLPRVRLLPAAELRAIDPEGESFRPMNTPEEYAAALATWRVRR
jgi:molybdenum cofactor guanylyltransferase